MRKKLRNIEVVKKAVASHSTPKAAQATPFSMCFLAMQEAAEDATKVLIS